MSEVVHHHVAVEHTNIARKTFLGEAVVVIPRLHLLDHCLYITVRWQHSHIFIICEHLAHILSRESEHLVKFGTHRHVPSDVESAGEVIECHWAHSREEYSLEHTLELLEYATVEAVGMGHLVIYVLAVLGQYHVGEVVILVNDEIKRMSVLPRHVVQQVKLLAGGVRLLQFPHLRLGIVVAVGVDEVVKLVAAIRVELLGQGVAVALYAREVEIQHLIFVAQRSRVLAHPQVAEQLVKTALHRLVVVGLHHTDKQALAKAAGTDEYQRARLAFQYLQIHRLVNIVQVVFPHRQEVGHSVWYLSYSFHHALRFILRQNYKKKLRNHTIRQIYCPFFA